MKQKSTMKVILPYMLAILAVLAAVTFALVMLWMHFHPPQVVSTLEPDELPAQNETPQLPDSSFVPTQPFEPDVPPVQNDEPQSPDNSATTATTYSYGALRLNVPDELLLEDYQDKTRMIIRPGTDNLPRLDGQRLQAAEPEENEYLRIAVGLLQAYYVDPPATDAISVDRDDGLPRCYTLHTDAWDDAPAMTARVRFLQTEDQLWYLVLVCPEGEEPDAALIEVFETARIESEQ